MIPEFDGLIKAIHQNTKIFEKFKRASRRVEFVEWGDRHTVESALILREYNPTEQAWIRTFFGLFERSGTACGWANDLRLSVIKQAISMGVIEQELNIREPMTINDRYYDVTCVCNVHGGSILLQTTDPDLCATFGNGDHDIDIVHIESPPNGRLTECKTFKKGPDDQWHRKLVVLKFIHDMNGWSSRPCFATLHRDESLKRWLRQSIKDKAVTVNLTDYTIFGLG